MIEYFTCQATGNKEICIDKKLELESYLYPGLSAASYFFLGTIPWSNILLFVLQVKDVKNLLRKYIVLNPRKWNTSSTNDA